MCAPQHGIAYRICVIIIIAVVCLTAIEQNVLRPSPRGPNDRGAFYFYCFSTAVYGKKTKSPYARGIFRGRKLSSSANTRGTRSSKRKKSTIETDSTGRVEISCKISRRFRRRFPFEDISETKNRIDVSSVNHGGPFTSSTLLHRVPIKRELSHGQSPHTPSAGAVYVTFFDACHSIRFDWTLNCF